MADELTLAELADSTGVPARTIRYYIARGILAGPVKSGRGACYDSGHQDRLKVIQEMQSRRLTLSEISRELAGPANLPLPEPSACWQYRIDEDVSVLVRAGAAPWRLRRIQNALAEFTTRITEEESDNARHNLPG